MTPRALEAMWGYLPQEPQMKANHQGLCQTEWSLTSLVLPGSSWIAATERSPAEVCLLDFCSSLLPHHRNLEFVEDGETPARKTTLVSLLFGGGMPGHKTGWRLSARGVTPQTPLSSPLVHGGGVLTRC